jgi:hypothetical protein
MGNSKSKNVQVPPSNRGAAVHTQQSKFDKITLNQIYKIYINSDISEPSTFSYLKKIILMQLRKKGYDKDTLPPNTKSMVTIYVMLYSLNEKYSEDINIPFYKNVNLMNTLMEKLIKNKQKYQNKHNTCNYILQGGERLTKKQIKILYNETLKNIDAGNNHNKIHYSDSWIRQSQTLVKITSSIKWSMNKENNTIDLLEKEIKSLRK